jgi:transcriptional regulator with XRE-family HTH domain
LKKNKRQSQKAAAKNDLELLTAIGHRLRQVRGFETSQTEFAQRLGISQSQLSKYERGQAAPTAEVLRRLKDSSGISIDWLLTGSD